MSRTVWQTSPFPCPICGDLIPPITLWGDLVYEAIPFSSMTECNCGALEEIRRLLYGVEGGGLQSVEERWLKAVADAGMIHVLNKMST